MYKTINKYWGIENWIQITNDYAFKKLVIKINCQILNHYHEMKEETFYIASGIGYIWINGKKSSISEGDTIHIKPNDRHQIFAVTDLIVFEASTPYLEDSIREEL